MIQRTQFVSITSAPSTPTNRSPRRRVWIFGLGLAGLLVIATLVPGSPIHFSVLFAPPPKDNGRGVRELVGALGHSDPAVRREAAAGLGRLNTAATESLPRLAELLRRDPDPSVRSTAADSIRKMGPASGAFVAELATALHDEDPLVRMNAALALLALKESAHPAVPLLIAAVDDEDNDTNLDFFTMTVRQAVVKALGGGVWCRVPVAVYTDEAMKTLPRAKGKAPEAQRPGWWSPNAGDRSARLAGVVAAWNIL